jgi:DNA segregation ATPase FtsK/SpoIIIE-like protein
MKGRQAGVFMVLTTQRPDADVIKTAIRDQLGLRIALGEMSKTGYSMVFGSDFNDLELNNSAPGNGFIFIDGLHTKPVKFQSPLFENNYNFVKELKDITRRG